MQLQEFFLAIRDFDYVCSAEMASAHSHEMEQEKQPSLCLPALRLQETFHGI